MAYHYDSPETQMIHVLANWLISAVALWLVAQFIPGMQIRGFGTAMIATAVIALVNATIGVVLKILTLPLTLLTFGLFLLIVNAVLLKLAAMLVPGFAIRGCLSAIIGSVVLTITSAILRFVVF